MRTAMHAHLQSGSACPRDCQAVLSAGHKRCLRDMQHKRCPRDGAEHVDTSLSGAQPFTVKFWPAQRDPCSETRDVSKHRLRGITSQPLPAAFSSKPALHVHWHLSSKPPLVENDAFLGNLKEHGLQRAHVLSPNVHAARSYCQWPTEHSHLHVSWLKGSAALVTVELMLFVHGTHLPM